jgi:hypothetical protein
MNMKEKITVLSLSLICFLMLSIFAFPLALADPNQGQKVGITINWGSAKTLSYEMWNTPSGVVHREATLYFKEVHLIYDDSTGHKDLVGTATEIRYGEWNQEGLTHRSCHRYYVITIPATADHGAGTFEGESKLLLTDYVTTTTGTTYNAMAHGLFHGTGAFEKQTINADDPWGPNDPSPVWTGYLLKP